ncbi:unnamed protein product [Staurois parvus]|uniref:Uncharacterized protein n=1 Tax=Staurois parvus TaxID=386267 RepID=A0ABN9EF55_9NEOB|nr:unnamed protein product [Staurois parvus]
MTADLWGGGERVPEFDRYPLLLPRSCSLVSVSSAAGPYLFLYPVARCLPGFCNGARQCTWARSTCVL